MKPKICSPPDNGRKTSQPSVRLATQMPIVLQVSIVDLAVAEMFLVTLRPKKLKRAMDSAMAKLLHSMAGELIICDHPLAMSK